MKRIIACTSALVIAACLVPIVTNAQTTTREPAVNRERRVTGPFTGSAEEVPNQPGLYRVWFGGSGDENSRVTANLSIGKPGQLVVSAGLATYEQNRVNPSPRKDWSLQVLLTRELAEQAEVSIYLYQVDAPYDSGEAYKVRVARLLPSATTQPAEKP